MDWYKGLNKMVEISSNEHNKLTIIIMKPLGKNTFSFFVFACTALVFILAKEAMALRVSAKTDGGSRVMACTKAEIRRVFGKIQFVDSFPDYKVKIVAGNADLKVQKVLSFPSAPGKWKIVNSFPDYKIQIVDAFPDFTIRYVDAFPGTN